MPPAPYPVSLGDRFLSDFTLTITYPVHNGDQPGSNEILGHAAPGLLSPGREQQALWAPLPWTSALDKAVVTPIAPQADICEERKVYIDKLPIHGLVVSSSSSFFKTKLESWTSEVSPARETH
jgi:hypothetical protein